MDVSKIEPGDENTVNVFIESTKGSKDFYKYDGETNNFILRKVLNIPFPGAYGFIPKTHHIDAEPLDVLVLIGDQTQQGVVLPARPIGIIRIKGRIPDDVLIAVPVSDRSFERINNIQDINNLEEVETFLEELKESKIEFVYDVTHARRSINVAVELYKKEFE